MEGTASRLKVDNEEKLHEMISLYHQVIGSPLPQDLFII